MLVKGRIASLLAVLAIVLGLGFFQSRTVGPRGATSLIAHAAIAIDAARAGDGPERPGAAFEGTDEDDDPDEDRRDDDPPGRAIAAARLDGDASTSSRAAQHGTPWRSDLRRREVLSSRPTRGPPRG